MLTLYRNQSDVLGQKIEIILKDLVVAHNIKVITSQADLPATLRQIPLPFIEEKSRCYSGSEAIRVYLTDLAKELHQWRNYQGDGCHHYAPFVPPVFDLSA